MKLYVLIAMVAMLGTFIQRNEGKAIAGFKNERAGTRLVLPILTRLGEESVLRLDEPKLSLRAFEEISPRAATRHRAPQRQLPQRLFQQELDKFGNVLSDRVIQLANSAERNRRGEESPISLDLTFHLLREVLEIARAEQLVQQASNNRRLMDFFGK